MKKVYLSDSGPKVSEAIYGFWRWENEGSGTTTKIERIINLCLELGINTFDHADSYGDFTIEEHFGKIIKNKSFSREDIVLFSKCGIRKSKDGQFTFYDTSRDHIIRSIENSLKKFNTDYLDIFLLQHNDFLTDPEETARALTEVVNSGKAKHIGVANYSAAQHQLLDSYLNIPLVTNHIELNLVNTTALHDGRIDYTKQRFCKPLAWAPLAGGVIMNGNDEKTIVLRAKLYDISKKYDANIEQTAVAWLMKLGTLPIIGSLSEDRIINAASASKIKLSHEDWYEIYQTTLV